MPINKTNADGGNGYGLPEYTLPSGYRMGTGGSSQPNTTQNKEELEKNGDSILTATLEEIITEEIGRCPENLVARLAKYIIKTENAYHQSGIEEERKRKITGETSDGYHTFNELYEFRKLYNAILFNEWASREFYDVHKSKRHSDGELCFGGGWFIVVAELPDGQISNHYELKDWDMFHCKEREKANTWDGHTEKDVVERLKKYIKRGSNV